MYRVLRAIHASEATSVNIYSYLGWSGGVKIWMVVVVYFLYIPPNCVVRSRWCVRVYGHFCVFLCLYLKIRDDYIRHFRVQSSTNYIQTGFWWLA